MSTSLEALYRSHGPMVLRRARAILADEAAAQDVLQEVFMQVMRSGQDFRGAASVVTWLYRITTNACLQLRRNRARRAQLIDLHANRASTVVPMSDTRMTVQKLLAEVPEELSEVAVYHLVDRMTHDEIAEVMGISRRTVGYRLDRFKQYARALDEGPVGGTG